MFSPHPLPPQKKRKCVLNSPIRSKVTLPNVLTQADLSKRKTFELPTLLEFACWTLAWFMLGNWLWVEKSTQYTSLLKDVVCRQSGRNWLTLQIPYKHFYVFCLHCRHGGELEQSYQRLECRSMPVSAQSRTHSDTDFHFTDSQFNISWFWTLCFNL